MKKLLLGAMLFLGSFTMMSQNTFIVDYHSCISKKEGVTQPWMDVEMTAVINEKNTGDIILYYGGGKSIRYKKIGVLTTGNTTNGSPYQIIECIDSESGSTVDVQYFNTTETLRILIAEGYYVEFHK
jgi:hypothetical protein